MRAEGPCIIGRKYPDNRFSTQQGKTEQKNKEGGKLATFKTTGKRTTLSFVYFFLFISKVKPSAG